MKHYFSAIILATTLVANSYAVDPQFSQFSAAKLYLSPSFAGSSGGGRLIMNVRDQWSKLPGTFLTYSASYDHYIEKYRSGVGVLVMKDDAGHGLMNTTTLGLQYSYNFDLNRQWRVRPGLHFYYRYRNIDFNKLQFSDQIGFDYIAPASIENSPVQSVGSFDASSSVLVYSENIWIGTTIDHLMSMSQTLVNEVGYLPLRYSIYGGSKHLIQRRTRSNKEESFSGAFHYLHQDQYNYLDIGAYYINSPLMIGLWYRGLPIFRKNPNAGAVSIHAGYRFKNLSLQYSYDFTTSRLITKTGGAHEISLTYLISNEGSTRRRSHKMVPCPEF